MNIKNGLKLKTHMQPSWIIHLGQCQFEQHTKKVLYIFGHKALSKHFKVELDTFYFYYFVLFFC